MSTAKGQKFCPQVSKLLGLALMVCLFCGIGTSSAQNLQLSKAPQEGRPATITDAAGRMHVRPTRQRITETQRRAAAQRRKELRDKAMPRNVPTRSITKGKR